MTFACNSLHFRRQRDKKRSFHKSDFSTYVPDLQNVRTRSRGLENVNKNVWSRELNELFTFDFAGFWLWTWRILTFNDGVKVKRSSAKSKTWIWRTQTVNEHAKLAGVRVHMLKSWLWGVRLQELELKNLKSWLWTFCTLTCSLTVKASRKSGLREIKRDFKSVCWLWRVQQRDCW